MLVVPGSKRSCEQVETHRIEATKKLTEDLGRIGTSGDVIRLMIQYVQSDDPVFVHDLQNAPCEDSIKDAITRQSIIGDSNFEIGWWSLAWQELHDILQAKDKISKYSDDKWDKHAQTTV